MSDRKVELLAPAGNFACFRAAVNAGADAVYLGGEQYGARAYAGNFTPEEIIDALRIAHIFGRKIYLTVNTLVKESEFGDLVPYLTPLCDAGLDGVIVQDVGVLDCLRGHFPDLELHASTQMTVTGTYGAAYLKRLGVCRVVPARELSLEEIRDIKEKTNLEVECFVHGAMCYAYSGQCLFSSILGGRSGNRGRCAGPCRLPYTGSSHEKGYPLSMKDMYTLPVLPELIQTGIDSFKIEGRMKSPEYVVGVTALYRKYIDACLENPDKAYKVDPGDEHLIRHLYMRSDTCDGYYHRHNGRRMITLTEPGYSGSSPEILDDIRERYLSQDVRLPITGTAKICAGELAELIFSCGCASVMVTGECVSSALNRPLDREDIAQRLGRLGDTCFVLDDLTVHTDGASFMPVKALNELRRMAVIELEKEIGRQWHLRQKPAVAESGVEKEHIRCGERQLSADKEHVRHWEGHLPVDKEHVRHWEGHLSVGKEHIRRGERHLFDEKVNELCVLVTTYEQLRIANTFSEIQRIYVDADILLREKSAQQALVPDKTYILVLPYIFRKRSYRYLTVYEKLLAQGCFAGVMVRNFEELEWLREMDYAGEISSDYNVYAWNNAALSFLAGQLDCVTLPLELNKKELNRLDTDHNGSACLVLYGYLPMMFSANCVRKTWEHCIKDTPAADNKYYLTDRYQNVFTVVQNCLHCHNIVYNTVPLSLHGQFEGILKKGYHRLRLDFSIEDAGQTRAVMEYYLRDKGDRKEKAFPLREFTNGHYRRGVE